MSNLSAYVRAFFNHENYHGWLREKKFFEGWYFKLVDKTEQYAFAIIPGIAKDASGKQQAFVQVLDGKKVTAHYFPFPARDFHPDPKIFQVQILNNQFSLAGIQLELPILSGALSFDQHFLWPKKLLAPGIMGWYSFVPFMECYHQVVSMHFRISGKLHYEGEEMDFTDGIGYLEKDWGRSFPEAWIWMQSNHFSSANTSFKLSVAKIPWVRNAFVGFICAFLLNGELIQFATYTGAKLKKVLPGDDQIVIELEDKQHVLTVTATRAPGAELAAPVLGMMDGRVKESMNALIHIALFSKQQNRVIFSDTGRNAGLEVAGDTSVLLNF